MTLENIASACGGTYYGPEANCGIEVSSVTTDSRKIEKNCLFVALRGARVDGHKFISQTIADGALCAISEQKIEDASCPHILVESSTQALKDIAAFYRSQLDIKVVGISGSVGKTSTKEMIASVLSQKYNVLKTAGNFNNEIGLPLTVFNLRDEHEIAVLEMGISNFGEMSRLARIARPDVCVITNIGFAHLENLKSRDGILKAKTEMFQYRNPEGCIVLNGDDDKLATLTDMDGTTPVFFGLDSNRAYHADGIENLGLRGTNAHFYTPDSDFTAHISIPGEHMVHNALAGIAVGRIFGMTDLEICQGIEALKPLAGRNNLIETERLTIIDDCYNANPASMQASLDVLAKAERSCGRRVAILGDMFELGPNEKELHREIGAYAVNAGIDVLICIGALSENMAQGAKEALPQTTDASTEVHHFAEKAAFLESLPALIHGGDTILVKASHGMEFPEIVEALKKF